MTMHLLRHNMRLAKELCNGQQMSADFNVLGIICG
jgi:hypothetical protein